VVQKNDDGQCHRHGTKDVRKPWPAAAQAAKNMVLTRHPQRLIRVTRKFFGNTMSGAAGATSSAPTSFISAGWGKQETEILIFNSLNNWIPTSFPTTFHLRRRGDLRAGIAAVVQTFTSRSLNARWKVATRFSAVENQFKLAGEIHDAPEFKILHYRHRSLASSKD